MRLNLTNDTHRLHQTRAEQAKYSPIDFDFLLYASQRLDGYRAFKAKFF